MTHYRNGTYVAFAADGGEDIFKSDIKYYNLLKAWKESEHKEFTFVNSHEKKAIREKSKDVTIENTLKLRLKKSNLFVLLVGDTTRLDDDFVPLEIEYAIDVCELPVVVCYVNHRDRIVKDLPWDLQKLLPDVLQNRIDSDEVKTLHIPFRQHIIRHAVDLYGFSAPPPYTMTGFRDWVYEKYYDKDKI